MVWRDGAIKGFELPEVLALFLSGSLQGFMRSVTEPCNTCKEVIVFLDKLCRM